MKYPWVSISILGIWASSALIIIAREDVQPEYILALALASTIVIGLIGFRTPK